MVKNLPLKLQFISLQLCVLLEWSSFGYQLNFEPCSNNYNKIYTTYCNDQKLSILSTERFCVFYGRQNKYLLHVLPKRLVFIMDTDCGGFFFLRRELKFHVSIKLKSICRVLDDVHAQSHQSNTRFICIYIYILSFSQI